MANVDSGGSPGAGLRANVGAAVVVDEGVVVEVEGAVAVKVRDHIHNYRNVNEAVTAVEGLSGGY